MTGLYPTRTLAARSAKRSGLRSFECIMHNDEWRIEPRKEGAGIDFALEWSEGKDYVAHVEMTELLKPVIVVTCFPIDIPDTLPKFFLVEPVTPSMLDSERTYRPKPPVATYPFRITSDSDQPLVSPITGRQLFSNKNEKSA